MYKEVCHVLNLRFMCNILRARFLWFFLCPKIKRTKSTDFIKFYSIIFYIPKKLCRIPSLALFTTHLYNTKLYTTCFPSWSWLLILYIFFFCCSFIFFVVLYSIFDLLFSKPLVILNPSFIKKKQKKNLN